MLQNTPDQLGDHTNKHFFPPCDLVKCMEWKNTETTKRDKWSGSFTHLIVTFRRSSAPSALKCLMDSWAAGPLARIPDKLSRIPILTWTQPQRYTRQHHVRNTTGFITECLLFFKTQRIPERFGKVHIHSITNSSQKWKHSRKFSNIKCRKSWIDNHRKNLLKKQNIPESFQKAKIDNVEYMKTKVVGVEFALLCLDWR